ncbi:hypothetical protein PCASD_01503 [Puccinia coronata f. sp. avenae]|uniref:Uncharacterized protein n=1 Tax=Puccinia coronata f. sp. avenae TaxID=200324 RepID=A0A2N5VKV2_9BASI|nr:hypothetical protein PCASD_01503 [Puccinia coronata f. sp. avenae]
MKFEVGWSAVKMLLALSNFGHPGPARGALCGSGEPLRARAGPRRMANILELPAEILDLIFQYIITTSMPSTWGRPYVNVVTAALQKAQRDAANRYKSAEAQR